MLGEGIGRAYEVGLNRIKFFVTLLSDRSSLGLVDEGHEVQSCFGLSQVSVHVRAHKRC